MITIRRLRDLVGHQVIMGFEDSMYGETTVRFGVLRDLSEDGKTITIDDYHDSAGFGLDSTRPTDGTPVEVAGLRYIKRKWGIA
jgi:hypothetical protein